MTTREYECALTGMTETGIESSNIDGLGDLPVGWTEIRIRRRQYNPRWIVIQQVKDAMIEGLLSQFPPEVQEAQRFMLSIQVEAQFHSLESATPMYISDVDETVYVSGEREVLEDFNDLRSMLGLEELSPDEFEGEDENEEIEGDEGGDDEGVGEDDE